jgi:hypothetical protein
MIESLLPSDREARVEYDIQPDHDSTQNCTECGTGTGLSGRHLSAKLKESGH